MPARSWLLFTVLLSTACVRHTPLASVENPNVITEDEIRDNGAGTIYEVIAQLRPEYLRDRGPAALTGGARDVAIVFLNSQEYGPLSILNQVAASDISEVRYYSGIDAVIKFGRAYGNGVIQLISRTH